MRRWGGLLARLKIAIEKALQTAYGLIWKVVENSDYGNQYILNEYASVRKGLIIPGRLQHGWEPLTQSNTYYPNNNIQTYVWSEAAGQWARNQGWGNFHSIGAPWLYLLANLENMGFDENQLLDSKKNNISELWVFGFHTVSPANSISPSLVEFIQAAIKSGGQSKVILLSWFDFLEIKKYAPDFMHKIKIVTLGERRNSSSADAHLYQVFHLLSKTELVITDYPTTLILYALTLGCEVSWFKNSSYEIAREKATIVNNTSLLNILDSNRLVPKNHILFANENLGLACMLTPTELKEIFGWDKAFFNVRTRFSGLIKFFVLLLVFPLKKYVTSPRKWTT
jgi:hypothetical protein